MSRKVKVSDIRQGVTLYEVMAFPHKSGDAWVKTFTVESMPGLRNTAKSCTSASNTQTSSKATELVAFAVGYQNLSRNGDI